MSYTRNVAKKTPKKRQSGKRNNTSRQRTSRGRSYSPAELFMAAIGALLIVLFLGIVITSIVGE